MNGSKCSVYEVPGEGFYFDRYQSKSAPHFPDLRWQVTFIFFRHEHFQKQLSSLLSGLEDVSCHVVGKVLTNITDVDSAALD